MKKTFFFPPLKYFYTQMKSSFFIILRISLPEKIFNQELNNIKNFRRQIN